MKICKKLPNLELELDCPLSSPGPVWPLFADPGPRPQVQVEQTPDLDLDQYWTWTLGLDQVWSGSGLGPKYCSVIIFKKIICH